MRLAVVLSGFPRRSETFALNELLALDDAGVLAAAFATKSGDGLPPHPDADRLAARVEVLPPVSTTEQAAVVAARLQGQPVDAVHGYFAHEPAEVAALAAARLGVPYGFSVHARDARKVAPEVLAARARAAACVVACNHDVAGEVSAADGRLHVLHHGVDLARFGRTPLPDGDALSLLAVGRLVEKKGFDVLVEATARLARPARVRIVGEGPEHDRLAEAARTHGVAANVELAAGRTHAELPDEYATAHAVVVPSVTDSSGDRDGLPNVVLEAMASGRPVVASDVGAIGTAVVDGETGLLVPPGDPDALASALETLAARPELARRLGAAGRDLVEREFALEVCTARLLSVLREAYV